ncbi:MFS transporter [Micromonospora sp. NPDC047707]|uniref:MFS transporter n=1 Tax=Micromonospora sp. NPDC047707 TaxID=3154498 RepID=UPI0034566755
MRRLWQAYSISELGSAVGAGALPLIVVLLLDCSALQVSLLAVVSGVASAAVAVPLGPWVEFRPKRPVMIGADVLRFAALASVPAAALLGWLTYGQLCVVAVAQTAGGIVFAAASGAHLRDLVPAEHRVAVYGRFETSQWMAHSAGSPAGGVLVSWLGATASVVVDAGSFLLSAVAVHRLRGPEPPPPVRQAGAGRAREAVEGWRYILGHAGLRALLVNAVIFGGGIMAAAPVVAVFMLRDLDLPPWQYGLAFGLPCLGGVLGSLAAGPLVRRYSLRPVLLAAGAARALWMGLIPAAPPGTPGLIVIVIAETLLLFFAGAFNPVFASYRANHTTAERMSRVITASSITSKLTQPVFVLGAGIIVATTDARTAITATAALTLTSVAFLPWRQAADRLDQADAPPHDYGEQTAAAHQPTAVTAPAQGGVHDREHERQPTASHRNENHR